MKKQILILAAAIVLLFLPPAIYAQKATRIKFAGGATAAVASGKLNNYKSRKVFIIKVREGQTMNVEQIKAEASMHYISVSIKSPSGADASDADASCNSRKEVAPTEAGDYTITVFECGKADEWRGKFKLRVAVK